MDNIKLQTGGFLLTLILCCIPALMKAQDVTFVLTNPRTAIESGQTYYLADVFAFSQSGLNPGAGQLYLSFDTTVLGKDLVRNNQLQVLYPPESILAKKSGNPQMDIYGDFIQNDNTNNIFSVSWQQNESIACSDSSLIDYRGDLLLTLKLQYPSGKPIVSPNLSLMSAASYSGQTFTTCGPTNCGPADCTNYPGIAVNNEDFQNFDCRVVYSPSDNGTGSIRQAIACATSGDTIRFSNALKFDSIGITSDTLLLDKSLYFVAHKDWKIYINGSAVNRLYHISPGAVVLFEGLNHLSGTSPYASMIFNSGSLILKDNFLFFSPGQDDVIINKGNLTAKGQNRLESSP